MTLKEIAKWANIKGLQLVGTGDFTHPSWLNEIKETLVADGATGLYQLADGSQPNVRFMLTSEVCTIWSTGGKCRKVHHCILSPSIEIVEQINAALAKRGNLKADGRPIFGMSAPELMDIVIGASEQNLVFPAHAWTPWFSVFGAFSGFDTIEACYQDTAKFIHALETGLSSDPPMNWRLSQLDKYTLLSNSDSHSFWPWRMGREANVFELPQVTYGEITDAIIKKDSARLKFTIETDPAYGKYHWTGHRACDVSLPAAEARKIGNVCPKCGGQLTEGVEQRVEELADRPDTYQDTHAPSFMRLLPLSEIIAAVLDSASPSTQAVWKLYNPLIAKFGDEYTVLIDATKPDLLQVTNERVADTIIKVREGVLKIAPGYDGVYGKLILPPSPAAPTPQASAATSPKLTSPRVPKPRQSGLSDFW
jgi:uncharacterized protein (TIGR00375 family)